MASHNKLPPKPFEGYPAYGAVHDVRPGPIRDFLYDFGRIADGIFTERYTPEEVNPIPDYVSEDGFESDPIMIGGQSPRPVDPEDDTADEATTQALQVIRVENGVTGPQLHPEIREVPLHYDSRYFYRIFDPESLGVTVLGMDPSLRAARAVRTIWEKQDFGAVEQEARDEMAKELPLVSEQPRLLFTRVDWVGRHLPQYPKSEVRQKLALIPDTDHFQETCGLIETEAAIIVKAIRKRLKQFMYEPDVMPHLTYTVLRREATPEEAAEVKKATNVYLAEHPLTVPLGALTFRTRAERSKPR